ncbi:MAG: formylglycine-generating enzyme family protein [Planctomycetes bacterium]|nr:formylglycine-generating enzyme family protein [Planctomycetota bacterium]
MGPEHPTPPPPQRPLSVLRSGLVGTALFALAAASPARAQQPEAPLAPGLIRLPGGRTQVGTDIASARRWIAEGGGAEIASETPRHEVAVAPFQLMPTELTREQFEVYVRATGARPPHDWAAEALEAARSAHVEAQSRQKNATGTGKDLTPRAFQPLDWWDKHWTEAAWQVAPEHASQPVVNVAFEEAALYAHWAGLRLVTEVEFQHAGRSGGTAAYPWGDAFAPERAATWERGIAHPESVGSFAAGATAFGVFDLVGNVWEWTTSEWSPFPGFKPLTVEVTVGPGKQLAQLEPSWDLGWRVAVGGAFDSRRYEARVSARVGLDPGERRANLGLRCARSNELGLDRIEWWYTRVLGPEARRALPRLDALSGLAAERWKARTPPARPPGYVVIERYDALFALPVARLDVGSRKSLEARAADSGGSLLIGVFESTLPLDAPALEPGVYLLAWRMRQPLGTTSRSPFGKVLPESTGMDELLFLDRNGEFIGRVNGIATEFERRAPRASTAAPQAAVSANGRDARILLQLSIPTSVEEVALSLRCELGMQAAQLEGAWSGLRGQGL